MLNFNNFLHRGFVAKRVKIVKLDYPEISLPEEGVELVEGETQVELGYLISEEKKEVRWKVKLTDKEELETEISIHSTRGGVQKKKIKIEK